MTGTPYATMIEARDIRKRYSTTTALDGVDLDVPTGTVYGLLGPNGAGKTTLVRILATLLRPDSGAARVAGRDVVREANAVRYRIGLTGQFAAVDEKLTGRENLRLFGRLYHLPRRQAKEKADALLERFGLAEAGDRVVSMYSGGMRRRLDIAASLLVDPAVLFLDEPTTGLDPRSRSQVWDAIRGLVREGTTVLLTTQYLDEADQLADRIGVIDRGRLIASGTPGELKGSVGGTRVEIVVEDPSRLGAAVDALRHAVDADPHVVPGARRISAAVDGAGGDLIAAAVRALDAAGIVTEDIALRRPTLDDVFLRLTGHTT
ncbi:ATP-binding cassette domain-containing protein [Dactylosporangium sp. AC04546]|uniref:ATP-binding cassette domain-containing protein n=1 Tax=Dactylosporangium sp. AC04546 TaxID=2862460 RepID=UPI001EDFA506|nr:ATP-binding cassette domain-containing protein [Dactylosporangium sp. AC04546]WVK88222.1 ATP-binding cassette domain-containing protein [Dactylosporangium sp. AC04546]